MAATGAMDRLYVHNPDRLARKYAYQVLLLDEFSRCGVEVIFLNHRLGQTPEEDLLLQVQGMVAEHERAKILERSRRGKLHAARHGSVNVLSGAPYGYWPGKHENAKREHIGYMVRCGAAEWRRTVGHQVVDSLISGSLGKLGIAGGVAWADDVTDVRRAAKWQIRVPVHRNRGRIWCNQRLLFYPGRGDPERARSRTQSPESDSRVVKTPVVRNS
jgi:hypothetical protein